MAWTTEIRAVLERQGHAADPDVVLELAQHAAATYEKARAEGADQDEARRQVQAQLDVWCRDAALLRRRPRLPPAVEPPPTEGGRFTGLAQDVRYALRVLGRQPGYTVVAVLTMALGIGATTALFGVANGVLLAPLPWPDADRLVRLSETREGGNNRFPNILTNATYLAWQDEPQTLDALAGYTGVDTVTLAGEGDPLRLNMRDVTPSLFPMIGATPLYGTLFGPQDEHRDVVVLSYGLWQQLFGGDPAAIGRTIQLDGTPREIVAVMPRDFMFPDRETRAWLPFAVRPVLGENPNTRSLSMFNGIGRLRAGVTAEQAAAEGTARGRTAPDLGMVGIAVFGTKGPVTVSAAPLLESMTADVRPAIVVFLVAVGLLLATATANVASLQLARATTRRRDTAIRSALGAGRGRIARQLLVESSLVGLAGGIAGLLLAAALTRALPTLMPAEFPRLDNIAVDLRVVTFALGLSLVTGVVFGLLPTWQTRRLDLVASLAEDGQAPVGGGRRAPVARARALIMAAQVGIACVLLVGAALLGRTFVALVGADRGYDPANVLTAGLPMPDGSFTTERRAQLLTALVERLRGQPGVRFAAVSGVLPLTRLESMMGFAMPARDGSSDTVQVQAMVRMVSPGYFDALGIRILEGRGFADTDTLNAQPVILVNRTFAGRYLGPAPVGQSLPVNASGRENHPDSVVVGVIDDVRQRGATDPPQPELYYCNPQREGGYGPPQAYLVVRTATDPKAFVPTLRALVREQDETLALDSVMTMEDRVWSSLAQPRLYAVLLGGFAIFALAIAGVGLFGVLSYNVAQRTREIGVRTALGATPGAIVRLVVGQGLTMTVIGLAAGLLASVWLTGLLGTFLYGVTAHDAISFAVVPLVLLLVALVACAVPARRAARVDPQRVLRAG